MAKQKPKTDDTPIDLRFSPTVDFSEPGDFRCCKCGMISYHSPTDTHKTTIHAIMKYVAHPERINLKCPGCGYHLGCRKPADAPD